MARLTLFIALLQWTFSTKRTQTNQEKKTANYLTELHSRTREIEGESKRGRQEKANEILFPLQHFTTSP